MSRTDAAAVGAIVTIRDGDDIAPFIEAANAMVTRHLAGLNELTAAELELVERWLSAHFYHVFRTPRASATAGPVSESKQYRLGLNLSVTMYGQQAITLDPTGTLARISKNAENGKTQRVGFLWLGTERTTSDGDC